MGRLAKVAYIIITKSKVLGWIRGLSPRLAGKSVRILLEGVFTSVFFSVKVCV